MVVTENCCFLGCDTHVIRMNVVALKVLGASSFKTLVAVIQSTRHYIPEDRALINLLIFLYMTDICAPFPIVLFLQH